MAATADDAMGQNGIDHVTGTSARTPGGGVSHWVALRALGGAATVVSVTLLDGTVVPGFPMAQGEALPGQFVSVTLSAGQLFAYRGRR